MSLTERLTDSVNAIMFLGFTGKVQTKDGAFGKIKKINVFRGEVVLFTTAREIKTLRGRDVKHIDLL